MGNDERFEIAGYVEGFLVAFYFPVERHSLRLSLLLLFRYVNVLPFLFPVFLFQCQQMMCDRMGDAALYVSLSES